jgi:hypothetical protein
MVEKGCFGGYRVTCDDLRTTHCKSVVHIYEVRSVPRQYAKSNHALARALPKIDVWCLRTSHQVQTRRFTTDIVGLVRLDGRCGVHGAVNVDANPACKVIV